MDINSNKIKRSDLTDEQFHSVEKLFELILKLKANLAIRLAA